MQSPFNFFFATSLNISGEQKDQEYPTKPLDKIPALQAEFELAGKKNIG